MAIADAKHMHRLAVLHVWRQYKCVLIRFLRVVGLKADTCCECKLLHNVLRFNIRNVRRIR